MKTEHFMVSTLDFFQVFFHEKLFFPKFELLNSGCGLSASLYGNCYDFGIIYNVRVIRP